MGAPLEFFDKNGNHINFQYDSVSETYNGDLIFDNNGSDTFKTIGLYTFENIPSFEYEDPNLSLEKFQLFNEYGFNITGSKYINQQITKVEAANNRSDFFSKWIYGTNFETKFPVGSEIIFDSPLFEFTNPLQTYTVVSTKKGASMIISSMDDKTFNSNFQSFVGLTSSYVNQTLSGINSIGVNSYLNKSLSQNLSSWSEPQFYTLLYTGRKLNIVNTKHNNSVVTVLNKNLVDKIYYNYFVNSTSLPTGSNLLMQITLKTSLPIVYYGSVIVFANSIEFLSGVPILLKPGYQIALKGSINSSYITIGNIPTFIWNNQPQYYYATGSQVLWNNTIYQCFQAYVQSATSSINPDNINYWSSNITYLPTSQTLTPEASAYREVYLTTNILNYNIISASSSDETLAFAAEKYASEFNFLNINLSYDKSTLNSTLNYASDYTEVKYYYVSAGVTYSIGTTNSTYEKTIQVSETLTPEFNRDISQRYSYNIVFTSLDDYGLIVTINGLKYQQEIQWAYSGLNVDMPRTVDLTLRAWLSKYYSSLYILGISVNLNYLVNFPYIYFDSITLRSIYPNSPIKFSIGVGVVANYYIQHSNIVFYEIGNVLSLTINNINYTTNFDTDVSTTLSNWIDTYSTTLEGYGIYTSYINNYLYFNIEHQSTVLSYTVNIGKSIGPGSTVYEITNKISGNLGSLITSNAAYLAGTQSSFLDISGPSNIGTNAGFATGMITSVNNTLYPFNNQEYNILEVDTNRLVFSYQGPFWGLTDSGGSTGSTGSVIVLGAFDQYEFDFGFDIYTTSTGTNYYTRSFSHTTNLVDLVYLNTTELIYVLGDAIDIYDGLSGAYIESINPVGLTASIKLEYDHVNDFLYVLSLSTLYKINPATNLVVNTFNLSIAGHIPYDCISNSKNGDIYVSYSNVAGVDVFDVSNVVHHVPISGAGGTFKMVYNQFEDSIYITTSSNKVFVISGTTRTVLSNYAITGLTNTITYNPVNLTIYVLGSTLNYITGNVLTSIPSVSSATFSSIVYNNLSQSVDISLNTSYNSVGSNNSMRYSLVSADYGYLAVNQYDEMTYMASVNSSEVLIVDSSNGMVTYIIPTPSNVTKMIFNPLRKTMLGIIPGTNQVIEIVAELLTYISVLPSTYNGIYSYQYGTLDPDYTVRPSVWLKTRSYIRKPRENYEGDKQVQYIWKWLTDDVPQMFLYDFSGTQLSTTGPYAYVGEKPLTNINLNLNPNKDISKTASSAYQQTIFSEIKTNLDYVNSTTDVSYTPEPLELFIGFNSPDEGVVSSTLLLMKKENISFFIVTNAVNSNIITFETRIDPNTGISYGVMTLNSSSVDNFLYGSTGSNTGLKVGQIIQVYVKDNTNSKKKFISFNNSISFKITEIYVRTIIGKFINGVFENESTLISNYPSTGKTTYMTTTITVLDKEVGRFNIMGQTEIEDIRYETELTNLGKNITVDDVFIFKTYDIEEQGVDWLFLNQKRKEMLLVKDSIFPYVGSYKAIINAINYFGYNDLELYEYYRNINQNSTAYGKLYKVEISGIFDNQVEGWQTANYLNCTMPNPNYEDSNLFNLTYRITDFEGNNVLLYSLAEVQIKLGGLKTWLERNVVPISHKILDITGRTDFLAKNSITHKNYTIKSFNIDQSMSPIDFNLNEAYLMPVNSGSTVYNCVVDFHSIDFDPYDYSTNTVPNYFGVKIRTYKTYPEWKPFRTYQGGDIVSYYQQNYISVIDNNRLNDPRKLQGSTSWNVNFNYTQGQIAEYQRNFYEYIGTQSSLELSSISTPFKDVLLDLKHWVDITQWRKLDYVPIQSINEFRTGTHSLHFTVDSNIDPYITIDVTSDNGYGQIYSSKKNYEIRSILDINESEGTLDVIGPIKIYKFLTSTTTSTTTLPVVVMWIGIDPYCEGTVPPTTTTTTSTTTTTTIAPTTTSTTTTLDCTLAGTAVIVPPPTTTTTSTTTTTTTVSYSLNVQWRVAGPFSAGQWVYSTNGGSSWTTGNANFAGGGAYGTAITINGLSNGQSILVGVRNISNTNVTFSTGNGTGYVGGFCGESSPYTVVISSPGTKTVYLNVSESTPGTLQTC